MLSGLSTPFGVHAGNTVLYSLPMTRVQQAAEKLIEKHGGLRKAARATKLDHGYLSRLRSGEKTEPSENVLVILGLEKQVTYKKRANGA